jgi:hypothetical protein
LGSFQNPIKSKGLTGFVLGSCGFVPQVNSMILNNLVGSFAPLDHFLADLLFATPSSSPFGDDFLRGKTRRPKSAVCATFSVGSHLLLRDLLVHRPNLQARRGRPTVSALASPGAPRYRPNDNPAVYYTFLHDVKNNFCLFCIESIQLRQKVQTLQVRRCPGAIESSEGWAIQQLLGDG